MLKRWTIALSHEMTGDGQYLTDHHNREGESLMTLTVTPGRDEFASELVETLGESLACVNMAASLEYSDIDLSEIATDFVNDLSDSDMWPDGCDEIDAESGDYYPNVYVLLTVKSYEIPTDRVIPGVLYELSDESCYAKGDFKYAYMRDQAPLMRGVEGYYTADMLFCDRRLTVNSDYLPSGMPVNIVSLTVVGELPQNVTV